MKKTLLLLAAIFCCAMTTTMFTACGDDDENDNPADRKVLGYQVNYSLTFPETVYSRTAKMNCGNLFNLFEKIEVGYVDENGVEQREVFNGQWTKSIIYKKSTKGYVKLYLTKPTNLDVESLPYEKYDQGAVCKPAAMSDFLVIYSDGSKAAPTLDNNIEVSTNNPSQAVSKDKLQNYLSKFKDEVIPVSFEFNF